METKAIYSKLLEVQKEVAPIKKTEDNPFFKSKYFDVNAILAALKPILSKHGLVLMQGMEVDDNGRNGLTTTVADAESGEKIESSIYLPDASDPQKFGSAVTYYRRYALQSLFALEAEDDDGNTASAAPAKPTATPLGKPSAKHPFDVTEYQIRLESTGSTEELMDVWLSFPQDAKVALVKVKEDLKKRYVKAGI